MEIHKALEINKLCEEYNSIRSILSKIQNIPIQIESHKIHVGTKLHNIIVAGFEEREAELRKNIEAYDTK